MGTGSLDSGAVACAVARSRSSDVRRQVLRPSKTEAETAELMSVAPPSMSIEASENSRSIIARRVDANFLNSVPVYVKEMIAGGAAGGFAKTAVAPLERLKILLQTRNEVFKSLGILQSLMKVKEHDGFVGFYRGNGASVLRIVPYSALHFMVYEQYRCWILNNVPGLGTGPHIDLIAGSAAGGTAVLCTYPLDLARTKLAYQVAGQPGTGGTLVSNNGTQMYGGIMDVFRCVYRDGGVRSLYRGVGAGLFLKFYGLPVPTLVGILPYAGLKFYIYEVLKSRVPERHKKSHILSLGCGALAGLFGQTLTYPLDVVRRQMQIQSQKQANQLSPAITGTVQGLRYIARTQGWKQLFAGLSLNYLKVVPSVAIGFTTYDIMKSALGVPERQKKPSSVSAAA